MDKGLSQMISDIIHFDFFYVDGLSVIALLYRCLKTVKGNETKKRSSNEPATLTYKNKI